MPAKSRRQQRLLYAKFGSEWVHAHHFDVIEHESPHAAHAHKRKKRK